MVVPPKIMSQKVISLATFLSFQRSVTKVIRNTNKNVSYLKYHANSILMLIFRALFFLKAFKVNFKQYVIKLRKCGFLAIFIEK